jgi:hypothetical protein
MKNALGHSIVRSLIALSGEDHDSASGIVGRRLIVCGTWTMSQRCRVAECASLTRARRGRMLVAGLVLLWLAGLGFIDPGAIAQEVVGQYRWRMARDPTVAGL